LIIFSRLAFAVSLFAFVVSILALSSVKILMNIGEKGFEWCERSIN